MMEPLRVLLVGAGDRGSTYAHWIRLHPDRARLVGIAEPRADRRNALAATHGAESFADWRDMTTPADAVVIATQDAGHAEPAIAYAQAGYAVLLEKPIAPTLDECRRVAAAARRSGVVFGVGHVLRYAPYTLVLRDLIRRGAIGTVIGIDHLEPVGFDHYAHSYVRGNWRRGTPMLLAKSCHDFDWLQFVVGRPIRTVSSSGALRYFHPGNRPAEAADRCLDCVLRDDCTYSAPRYYGSYLAAGETGWPVSVLAAEPDADTIAEALRSGPYGRCVWSCDNDVVDHQVVAMEFDGGTTATFTMTAFSTRRPRETRLFGTGGELVWDGSLLHLTDFRTGRTETIAVPEPGGDDPHLSRHNGGDAALMDAFVTAAATHDPAWTGPAVAEALSAHEAVFAAEESRRTRRVVTVSG